MRPATGSWIRRSKVHVRPCMCNRLMPRASTPNRTLPLASQWLQRSRWPLAEANWWAQGAMFLTVQHDLLVFHTRTNQARHTKKRIKGISSCETDLGDDKWKVVPKFQTENPSPPRCSSPGFRHWRRRSREASCWLRWIHISVFGFRFQHFRYFLIFSDEGLTKKAPFGCAQHREISKPYAEVLLKILRSSNLPWWFSSRLVGIVQDLGRQRGPKHAKTCMSS